MWHKPGEKLPLKRTPKARTKPPHDPTYGSERDLLDEPGMFVEPDVREKISKYFRSMGLREWIRSVIEEVL